MIIVITQFTLSSVRHTDSVPELQEPEKLIDLLLKRGTPVNAKGGSGLTALALAEMYGLEAAFKTILMDHGADVNF